MSFDALRQARFEGSKYARQIHAAARRRLLVGEQSNAWRWIDSVGDRPGGFTVDVYREHGVLGIYNPELWQDRLELGRALLSLGLGGVYVKNRVRADLRRLEQEQLAPAQPLCGEAAGEVIVSEHDMRFAVRLDDGLSTGLFIDQRDNRMRLRSETAGRRVLNLFAYTCSFSVAAGLGGAREVVSVDLSRRALQRGGRNLQLNALTPARHRLLRADAMQWLERAERRRERFDWVVLDPPSFASRGRNAFSVRRDYAQAAQSCLGLLAAGGRLLAVTNHRETSRRQFLQLLREAAQQAGRAVRALELLPAPVDCPLGAQPDLATKSAVLELGG